LTVVTIYPDA